MNDIYKKQVALLIRIMPSVYRIKDFAVHGGTAINLFHKNMPRYSVDIDLTYIPIQEREESLKTINEHLRTLKANIEKSVPGIKIVPKYDVWKLQCTLNGATVKIEVNGTNPKYSINNSKDSYSTPETVCHVIQEYAEQNQGKSVQEMIDLWNGISERNDCLVDSWAPSPNDKQPFANKRRSEIKWGDKSVWVTRGWTEEIFQTFIRNAKEQLGVIIEKVE